MCEKEETKHPAIYNPGMDGGASASGFVTEHGTGQTHNVPETLPGDETYSPLRMSMFIITLYLIM